MASFKGVSPSHKTERHIDETDSALTSDPFLFIVGQEKTEFHAHSDVISRLSSSLSTLVHGNMVEARNHTAILEDVDEDLFACFIQYAYTGNYSEPVVANSLLYGNMAHVDHSSGETGKTFEDLGT
jgi:hypothetical protein